MKRRAASFKQFEDDVSAARPLRILPGNATSPEDEKLDAGHAACSDITHKDDADQSEFCETKPLKNDLLAVKLKEAMAHGSSRNT